MIVSDSGCSVKPQYFGRTVQVLKHQAISLAHSHCIIFQLAPLFYMRRIKQNTSSLNHRAYGEEITCELYICSHSEVSELSPLSSSLLIQSSSSPLKGLSSKHQP